MALHKVLFDSAKHSCLQIDIMHGYLGLACLSIYGELELQSIDTSFAISVRARERLRTVSWWKGEISQSSLGDSKASDTIPSYVAISGG